MKGGTILPRLGQADNTLWDKEPNMHGFIGMNMSRENR